MAGLPIRSLIRDYFQHRIFLAALVLILFIMGVIFGVLAANILESSQKEDLLRYVHQGLQGSSYLENTAYTRQTIISNVQTVFFLFFMGISVIGVPLALLLIFTRGFILGFSVGFLLQTMGLKGVVLAMAGILPHNALLIPGLLFMVMVIIDCAAALTKIRFTRKPVFLGEELVRCAILTLLVLVVVVIAGYIQGQVTPIFTAWVARLLR